MVVWGSWDVEEFWCVFELMNGGGGGTLAAELLLKCTKKKYARQCIDFEKTGSGMAPSLEVLSDHKKRGSKQSCHSASIWRLLPPKWILTRVDHSSHAVQCYKKLNFAALLPTYKRGPGNVVTWTPRCWSYMCARNFSGRGATCQPQIVTCIYFTFFTVDVTCAVDWTLNPNYT